MMSSLLDLAVFPGNQGGPIAYHRRKSSCFCEALQDEFFTYALQLQKMLKLWQKLCKERLSYHFWRN
jgi:glycine hydroxymethyltransferase